MTQLITRFMSEINIRSDRRLRLFGISLFILACAACIIGLAAFSDESNARFGWAPYLASTALLIAAVYTLIPYKKAETQLQPMSPVILVTGFLILSLAIFMRFFRFESVPYGTWNDEAYIGMIARNILADPGYRPIYIANFDHPLHFYGLVAFALNLFGDSTSSIRLVTVIFGLATLGVAFLVGRETLGNRFGLFLAFFFAISRWHVTFSRFGVYTITMPFFELLTIWLLLRARRTNQIHDFLGAGLAFGYGLNFYIGIRLFVPVILFYFALWLISACRRSTPSLPITSTAWPILLRGLAALTLAAGFAIAPVAQYALTHSDVFWRRSGDVSIFTHRDESNLPKALYTNTIKHLLMFNLEGDPNGRHNLSGEPMLDPVTGGLFVLGFIIVCTRIRQPTYSLFLMLFVFNLLGGILTVDFEAPQSNRALGSISGAIFFAAVGVEALWHGLEKTRISPSIQRAVLTLITLGFGGYTIYYNANTFFIRQANENRTWLEFNGTQAITAQRMLEADPTRTIIYASVYLNDDPVVQFLAPQITDSRSIIPPIGLPVRETGDKPVAIFMESENTWIVEQAKLLYPNAQFRVDNTPAGNPALYSILISPEDIQRLQGVKVSYWAGNNQQGEPVFIKEEKSIQADWSDPLPNLPSFNSRFETTLYVPISGKYELILHTPAKSGLWIDEHKVLNGSGEQHLIQQLAQGDHVLRLDADSGKGMIEMRWRPPDSETADKLASESIPIPKTSLYLPSLVSVHGLLGNYYNGASWSGTPAFSRIDPFFDTYFHIIPLDRPYTVDWSGQIEIPASGEWLFGLRINGHAQVFINDQLVVNAPDPGENIEGAIGLTIGKYPIHIRYLDDLGGSRLHLYWTAPGGQREIIPSNALTPFP